MTLYRPSELFPFLKSLGIEPKKSLSQNFLIDGNIIRKIVDAGNIEEGDPVLEIGPGPGCLTEALLEKTINIVAIEKDRVLANALNRFENVKTLEEDALKVPLDTILKAFPQNNKKIKLIANLPYHITTPLLAKFVPLHDTFDKVIVMVQDEVGKRITAAPNTSDFGSLSLFLSYFADCKYLFKVSRKCFYPAPKVDSAVILFNLKKPKETIDTDKFFELTRQAFQQRRKALRGALSTLYPKALIEKALSELQLDPLIRGEALSLDQFIALFKILTS